MNKNFITNNNKTNPKNFLKNFILTNNNDHNMTTAPKERIKKVTPQDIMNCAKKYFNEKSVTVILKP